VSISNIRKSGAETPQLVSKGRGTQRRPVGGALLHRHLFRVNAAELARRQFLHLAAVGAALPAVLRIARAQAYPTRPVRIVVAAAAGGPTDIVARLMGQWLSERLGQQFVIENRPGAGSSLGTEAVVHSPADGYTLLWSTRQMRLTRRSTKSLITISSATSRPSRALCARSTSWR
jgi:hypothetical protein